MTNLNFHSCWRTSNTFHVKRPHGGSARIAWDWLAEKGPIESMRLLDGWWMCQRPGIKGPDEGIEAVVVLHHRLKMEMQDKD